MTQLFINKLTNLDFSFLDPKRGLVGESWLIDIELTGTLNDQGMVLDFGIVKRLVRDYVDQYIDHCLLVPVNYDGIDIQDLGEQKEIAFRVQSGHTIIHRSNAESIAVIPCSTINTDTIREFLLTQLKLLLPDNVSGLDIKLYTEPGLKDSYQYSHGLRKHKGNCQRIAHGHRSDLQIMVDGQPSEQWQQYWIQLWQDIYLGTSRHLVDIQKTSDIDDYYHFNYQTPQGAFYLKLPKTMCYIIDDESTVEKIAQYLAEKTAQKIPGKVVKVIAYEGIGKGAVAEFTY
ncbi:MAG: hypothetical protein GY829_05545 [Gammaproteobacteria bacterium]|nr:hypothetical protein [Gammaproteobacteria bacterium]